MPNMDGTGPRGQGPRQCRGYGLRKTGTGFCQLSKDEQVKFLQSEKNDIEKKLKELE